MIATLVSKRTLCQGTEEFEFEVPEMKPFLAGSYTFLTIDQLDSPDPRGPRRHFTISSSPQELPVIRIASRIRKSGLKQTLHNLPFGAKVEVTQPYLELSLPQDRTVPLTFIAGGIGITPFYSIITDLILRNEDRHITLLYFNTSQANTPYQAELKKIEEEYKNISIIFIMTKDPAWQGETGRLDSKKLLKYIGKLHDSVYYIVGPEKMCQSVEDILISLSVPDDQIKREDFTGY